MLQQLCSGNMLNRTESQRSYLLINESQFEITIWAFSRIELFPATELSPGLKENSQMEIRKCSKHG